MHTMMELKISGQSIVRLANHLSSSFVVNLLPNVTGLVDLFKSVQHFFGVLVEKLPDSLT